MLIKPRYCRAAAPGQKAEDLQDMERKNDKETDSLSATADTAGAADRSVKKEKNNSEQAIMAAAEELFLELGYNLTTTTMVARKAGVTHAMLHYYFRTKEHIFIRVLDKNLNEMMSVFQPVMKKDIPFWENMKSGISTYFDFLERHPRLPAFLYDTIRFNPELIGSYKPRIRSTLKKIIGMHCRMISDEASKGAIRDTDPVHLMTDIATLSLSTFMFLPVAQHLFDEDMHAGQMHRYIEERKRDIIELVKSRLYGELPEMTQISIDKRK